MVCHIELFVLRWLASFLAIMELLSNSPALTVDCANNTFYEQFLVDQPDPALLLKSDRVGDQPVTRSPHRRARHAQTRRRSDTANYVKLRRAAQTPAYAPATEVLIMVAACRGPASETSWLAVFRVPPCGGRVPNVAEMRSYRSDGSCGDGRPIDLKKISICSMSFCVSG